MNEQYTTSIRPAVRVLKEGGLDSMRMLRDDELDAVNGGCVAVNVGGRYYSPTIYAIFTPFGLTVPQPQY
jgi:hypothetical protein